MSMFGSADARNPELKSLPGEKDIEGEAADMFANAEQWMTQKHPLLGGRSPRECVAAGDAQSVRDLLRNLKFVGQT
jgi:uncharacterized protein (DUF2384 family)